MSAKVLMDVAEYLRTSFDGPDREYLDGEVEERNAGELPHADVLGNLCRAIHRYRSTLGIRVVPVIRIQINPRRYRVADLAIFRDDDIGTGIPTVPPFLAVEILSPEVRMTPKVQEYLSIGVEFVWVIDPQEKRALCYSQSDRGGAECHVLRTKNPAIEIPLEQAFDLDA